jgi:hypothetical protein
MNNPVILNILTKVYHVFIQGSPGEFCVRTLEQAMTAPSKSLSTLPFVINFIAILYTL